MKSRVTNKHPPPSPSSESQLAFHKGIYSNGNIVLPFPQLPISHGWNISMKSNWCVCRISPLSSFQSVMCFSCGNAAQHQKTNQLASINTKISPESATFCHEYLDFRDTHLQPCILVNHFAEGFTVWKIYIWQTKTAQVWIFIITHITVWSKSLFWESTTYN